MIKEIKTMLTKLERVCVVVYPADPEGRYTVSISCKAKDNAGENVKSIEDLPPLRLHGTAEEIDTKMGDVIANWGGSLGQHFDNMEAIDQAIKGASKKKPAANRARKKATATKEDASKVAKLKSDDGPRFGEAAPAEATPSQDDLLSQLLG